MTTTNAVSVLHDIVADMLKDGYITIGAWRPALEKALAPVAATQPAGDGRAPANWGEGFIRKVIASRTTPTAAIQSQPEASELVPLPEPLQYVRGKFRGEFDEVEPGDDYFNRLHMDCYSKACVLADRARQAAEPTQSTADTVRNWMGENDVVLSKQAYRTLCQIVARQAAIAQPSGAVRQKLATMQSEEDQDAGIIRQWYFDCDGHYIDVACDDGKYSVYFRNRADGKEAWLDQAAAPQPPASAPEVQASPTVGSVGDDAKSIVDYVYSHVLHHDAADLIAGVQALLDARSAASAKAAKKE